MDDGFYQSDPYKQDRFQEALLKECWDLLPGFSSLDAETAKRVFRDIDDINYKRAGPHSDVGFVELQCSCDRGYVLFSKELKRAYLYHHQETDREFLHNIVNTLMRSAGWGDDAAIASSIEDRGRLEPGHLPPYSALGREVAAEHRKAKDIEYAAMKDMDERPYFIDELLAYYAEMRKKHQRAADKYAEAKWNENADREEQVRRQCEQLHNSLQTLSQLGLRCLWFAKAKPPAYGAALDQLGKIWEEIERRQGPFTSRSLTVWEPPPKPVSPKSNLHVTRNLSVISEAEEIAEPAVSAEALAEGTGPARDPESTEPSAERARSLTDAVQAPLPPPATSTDDTRRAEDLIADASALGETSGETAPPAADAVAESSVSDETRAGGPLPAADAVVEPSALHETSAEGATPARDVLAEAPVSGKWRRAKALLRWTGRHAPPLIVGASVGAGVRIAAQFAVAALVTTAPGIVGIIGLAMATGAVAGGLSRLIVTALFGGAKKKQPNWRRRAFGQGALVGAFGGALGAGIAHWFMPHDHVQGIVRQHPPAGRPALHPRVREASAAATAQGSPVSSGQVLHSTNDGLAAPELGGRVGGGPGFSIGQSVGADSSQAVKRLVSARDFQALPRWVQKLGVSHDPKAMTRFCKEASYHLINRRSHGESALKAGAELIGRGLAIAQSAGIHNRLTEQLHADLAYLKMWGIGTPKDVTGAIRNARMAGDVAYGGRLLRYLHVAPAVA